MSPPPSFLGRQTWGLSNWLWIALVTAMVLGFVPRGMRRAVESNTNKAEDWLPAAYTESADLRWFARHFASSQFILMSWKGCTLGNDDKLRLLASKLPREKSEEGHAVFSGVMTGPEMVASLTRAPANLERPDAIRRLAGALIGPPKLDAQGVSLGDETRTTCLIAYLTPEVTAKNKQMREVIERAAEIASTQCGIPAEQLRMGGPPVDNVTIDIEGEKTLMRLAGLSGLVGLVLSYWCFRSWKLTGIVLYVGGLSAAASLAIVYYYGVFEVFGLGKESPELGSVDAILMSMPAVVYVLGLSGAIHLVNYYRDERDEHGPHGAVERGVGVSWGPCALAAFTTAVGLGSLGFSDIVPIKKFGIFTASGVMATIAILFAILPVFLHLFPEKKKETPGKPAGPKHVPLPLWAQRLADFVTRRYGLVSAGCLAAMVVMALGLPMIQTRVQLLKLLDQDIDLIHDYAWLEDHLGNLVPMEVVVTLDADQCRTAEESPFESGNPHYRMTMVERMRMIERIEARVETLDEVSRTLSAATFGPGEKPNVPGFSRERLDYTISTALEENRDALGEYLQRERPTRDAMPEAGARELWRVSARVAALGDIDYGLFVSDIKAQVEPVLNAYRDRDTLMAKLQEAGKSLGGASVSVVFMGEDTEAKLPAEGSSDGLLVEVLRESNLRFQKRGGVLPVNLAMLRQADEPTKAKYLAALAKQDVVITSSATTADEVRTLLPEANLLMLAHQEPTGVSTVDAVAADTTKIATTTGEQAIPVAVASSYISTYTGIVPLVYKTQRELLASLRSSIGWATVLIGCVMVVLLRSPGAGFVSMIPNIFPVVMVFGGMGWLGVKVDIGIMMCASVALGVAVDDTIHFLTWFRRGIVMGLDRRNATMLAFERCATAMLQTTMIAGLGLAVFATSTFTPTQQFGTLMIIILGVALVGDLVMLPALLVGPLGRFFAPGSVAFADGAELNAAVLPFPGSDDGGSGNDHPTGDDDGPDGQLAEPQPEEATIASLEASQDGEPKPADASPATQPIQSIVPPPHKPSEDLSPTNAALRSKLQKFRRQ